MRASARKRLLPEQHGIVAWLSYRNVKSKHCPFHGLISSSNLFRPMLMTTVPLPKKARAVLDRCEKTAAWYGIEISNLDQRNHLGDTPLHTVCSWGEVDPVSVLLDAGAKVNARGDRGCTPLFNAVIGESAGVVNLLLEKGADPAIRSSDGLAVLDYALNTRAPKAVVEALRMNVRLTR